MGRPAGGLRARVASVGHALRGLADTAREPNARIHVAAAVLVLALGAWLRLSRGDWCWIAAAIAAVWSAEAMNSAVERLADAVSLERRPELGRAKDAAAGAVLVAALGAATIGLLVLGPPLFARLAP